MHRSSTPNPTQEVATGTAERDELEQKVEELAEAIRQNNGGMIAIIVGRLKDEETIKKFRVIFKEKKGENLEEQIKECCPEKSYRAFKKLLLNKVMMIPRFKAQCLYEALTKKVKNHKTVCQIICPNEHLQEIKTIYQKEYHTDLVDEVTKMAKGYELEILRGLLDGKIMAGGIQADISTLESIKNKQDLDKLVDMLTHRSEEHLREVIAKAKNPKLKKLLNGLDKKCRRAMFLRLAVLEEHRMTYFAESISHCMKKSQNNPRPEMILLSFDRKDRVELAKRLKFGNPWYVTSSCRGAEVWCKQFCHELTCEVA